MKLSGHYLARVTMAAVEGIRESHWYSGLGSVRTATKAQLNRARNFLQLQFHDDGRRTRGLVNVREGAGQQVNYRKQRGHLSWKNELHMPHYWKSVPIWFLVGARRLL